MKIGILTFHEGLNHGGFLQAWSLVHTLGQMGHEPVIINYKNPKHWRLHNLRPWFTYRRPIRFIDRFQKTRAFTRDLRALPRTAYTRNAELVRQWRFDAVVVGSDVVWDTRFFGFDPLYFGSLNSPIQIAYAPSCGASVHKPGTQHSLEDGLRSFHALSARDEATQQWAATVTGNPVPLVPDPCFLPTNFSAHFSSAAPQTQPYLLVYGNSFAPGDGPALAEAARQRGWEIVSIGYRNPWADRSMLSVGPLAIFPWFRAASAVVSSTFHGTIFSLLAGRPFATRLHPAIRSKASSLLQQFTLPERGLDNMTAAGALLDQPLPHDSIEVTIADLRRQGIAFLRHALDASP